MLVHLRHAPFYLAAIVKWEVLEMRRNLNNLTLFRLGVSPSGDIILQLRVMRRETEMAHQNTKHLRTPSNIRREVLVPMSAIISSLG